MRTPVAAEFQSIEQPGGSADQIVKAGAHQCFRGARLLLGALVVSVAIWIIFGWGLRALLGGL